MSSLVLLFSEDDCDGNGNELVTSNVDPTSKPSNCPVTNDGCESRACFAICRITEPSICTECNGGVSGTDAFSFSAAGFDANAANEEDDILSLAAAVALDREILFLLKSSFVSYTSRKMRMR